MIKVSLSANQAISTVQITFIASVRFFANATRYPDCSSPSRSSFRIKCFIVQLLQNPALVLNFVEALRLIALVALIYQYPRQKAG
ncbi:MAG: hypothetical protein V7K92_18940 [Nostoc sp.]|uniref:hypothetical protein n=1 Tax=Nostoc sp. TaxID=1180 RepID=UPI002FF09A5A